MAERRSYISGYQLLEINGQSAGFVHTVEGGYPYAEAVIKPLPTGEADKEPGETRWTPIVVTFGPGSEQPLYDWVTAMINGSQSPTDGVVIFLAYDLRQRWRLEFDQAVITQLQLPALSAASKEAAYMTMTITPLVTRRVVETSVVTVPPPSAQKVLSSSFQLSVVGLDTHRVTAIEPIVLTQPIPPTGPPTPAGPVDVGNIRFTAPLGDLDGARVWLDDFVVGRNYGPNAERTGTLAMLSANRTTTLFRFDLTGLGILRLEPRRFRTGAEAIESADVELYCEQVTFTTDVATTLTATVTAASAADTAREVDIADLTVDTSPQPAGDSSANRAENVADRLVTTETDVALARSEDPSRLRGQDVGRQWATTTATLEELQDIAGLEGTSWNAIALGPDHTLNQTLQKAGIILANSGGVDLQRDPFVEGIVSGAAAVYRAVGSHLPDTALRPMDRATLLTPLRIRP
jgi:hypothetical protein